MSVGRPHPPATACSGEGQPQRSSTPQCSSTPGGAPQHDGAAFGEALAELAALQQRLQELHEREVEHVRSQCGRKFELPSLPAEDASEELQQVPAAAQPQFFGRAVSGEVEDEDGFEGNRMMLEESVETGHSPTRASRVKFEDSIEVEDAEDASPRRSVTPDDVQVRPFMELRPDWRPDTSELQRRMSSLMMDSRNLGTAERRQTQSRMKALKSMNSFLQSESGQEGRRFMLHPQSTVCLLWDLCNVLFITYELIMTPVQVFVVPDQRLFDVMDWLATVFWTADVGLTFFRATYINSEIEWHFRRVAKHYLRTWFFIDVLVIVPDWLTIIGGVATLDAMSFFRAMRLLKLMRLLRLVKMEKVVRGVQQRINQTYSLNFLSILRLVACIVIFNHLLACIWYRIGLSFEGGWAKASLELDPFFGYWTALHWSLTQFHGSMEVNPVNVEERIFAVAVVLLALIGFSQFLSSLTDMMIQLQRLRHDKTRQQDALRSYLTEHNISAQTSVSVKRYIEFQVDMQQRQAHQLEVLQILPKNLLMDLHDEARTPILVSHTLFQHFRHEYPRAVRMLCHEAVGQLPLHNGEKVFIAGDACSRMLFVDQGSLVYSLASNLLPRHREVSGGSGRAGQWKLRKSEWICEIALWTVWENVGDLVAFRSSMLLEVDAAKFASVLRQFQAAYLETALYAQEFLSELNRWKTITDLDFRFEDGSGGGGHVDASGRRRSRDVGSAGGPLGGRPVMENDAALRDESGRRFSWASLASLPVLNRSPSKSSSGARS